MSSEQGRPAGGFTLVEVLVALAIVAFGLIAVFGQLSQSATAAIRLRDKTIAHWIAMNVLTERRLLREPPGAGTESDDIEMANARWHYVVTYAETGVEGMRRAEVTVAFADDDERPIATATGFLTEDPHPAPVGQPGGWRRIDPAAAESVAHPELGEPGATQDPDGVRQ